VGFVTGRPRSLSSSTVQQAMRTLVRPGEEDRSGDPGGTPSAP
jgi:hypothetical protein